MVGKLSPSTWITNEVADNDEDAKKMRKAEKEAQRKIAEIRATGLAKNRSKFSRPLGSATIPSPLQHSYSPSISSYCFPSPASSIRGPAYGGQVKKPGTCFIAANLVIGVMNAAIMHLSFASPWVEPRDTAGILFRDKQKPFKAPG